MRNLWGHLKDPYWGDYKCPRMQARIAVGWVSPEGGEHVAVHLPVLQVFGLHQHHPVWGCRCRCRSRYRCRCFTNAPKSEISFMGCEVWYFNSYGGCMWKGVLLWQVHQVPHWTWKFTGLCGFSCDFAKLYFWTTCHTKYNASKSLFLVIF